LIRNSKMVEEFEKSQIRGRSVDIAENFRIIEALYAEAVQLGIIPLKNPLDGLDAVLQIAKVVNSVPGTSR
jgi:hypothetical protein